MAEMIYDPLADLVDQWSRDPNAPGTQGFLYEKLLEAICDQEFFPDGLAMRARRLLLSIAQAAGEAGLKELQPINASRKSRQKPTHEYEPIGDLISLHSYFHPLLDMDCSLPSDIVEDVELFFEWLKNSKSEQRPREIDLVLNSLAIKRSAFCDWCTRLGWPIPAFLAFKTSPYIDETPHPPNCGSSVRNAQRSAFDATYWNLIQSLGWIYFRDREFVEEMGRSDVKPNQAMLITYAEDLSPRLPSIAMAKGELLEALRVGSVTAIGILNNKKDPKQIPEAFWVNAKFADAPEVAISADLTPWSAVWHGLKFPRQQVLQNWPAVKARIRTQDTLSFEQIAGRWLAEIPDSGLTKENLAVDLVKLAEAGTFTEKTEKDGPHPENFDPHLFRVIHTYDDRGIIATPDDITRYSLSGGHTKTHNRRLLAARDISVSLTTLVEWTTTIPGQTWLAARGLKLPAFLSAFKRSFVADSVYPTVKGETECLEWLLDLMRSKDQTHPKDYYKNLALEKFRVSGQGFTRSWAIARRESGNLSWGKAGRKSSRVNRFTN